MLICRKNAINISIKDTCLVESGKVEEWIKIEFIYIYLYAIVKKWRSIKIKSGQKKNQPNLLKTKNHALKFKKKKSLLIKPKMVNTSSAVWHLSKEVIQLNQPSLQNNEKRILEWSLEWQEIRFGLVRLSKNRSKL